MGWGTKAALLPFKTAALPFKAGAKTWKALPADAKGALGFVAAIGAGVGFLTYEATSGRTKGTKFNPDEQPIEDIPMLLTPQDLMQQPQPQQISMDGPPDDPNMTLSRNVLASRGQGAGMEQPQRPAQPSQSIIDPDSVQQLGAINKTQAV